MAAMVILSAAGVAQGIATQTDRQFIKISVGGITAVQTFAGKLDIAVGNNTQDFPVQVRSGQAIASTAQFPLTQGLWRVTLTNANSTVLDLSGQLVTNGSVFSAGYAKSSAFNSRYVSLRPTDQSVIITVGYTKGSVAINAQTKDKSIYIVNISVGNPTENGSVHRYAYSASGPSVNVSTPIIDMGLVSNVEVTITSQNHLVAHMNRTYDVVTGVDLSGVKSIDDPSRILVFEPILTVMPYAGVIALNNSELLTQNHSATLTPQQGLRIKDSTSLEPTYPNGTSTTKISTSHTGEATGPAQQNKTSGGFHPLEWLRTSVEKLASALGTNANWLWLGIAAGLTILIVTAAVKIVFT